MNETTMQCAMCSAGTWPSEGGVACGLCPVGKYSDDTDGDGQADAPCAPCDAGTEPKTTGVGNSECVACQAGYFSSDGECAICQGQVLMDGAACLACPGGAYYDALQAVCTPCPADTKFIANSTLAVPCEACAEGKFSGAGSAVCTDMREVQVEVEVQVSVLADLCPQNCSVGFEDLDCLENTGCTECAEGQYSAGGFSSAQKVGAGICFPCSEGRYAADGSDLPFNATLAQFQCELCGAGTADEDENAWTPCTVCEEGTTASLERGGGGAGGGAGPTWVGAAIGAYACRSCPAGQIDDDSNSTTDCATCSAGSYAAPKSGPSGCVTCRPGSYDHDALPGTPCEHCPAGSYSSVNGSYGHATPASMWQNTSCQLCEVGKFNENTGSTEIDDCSDCLPGTFAAMRGEANCEECPIGTFRSGIVVENQPVAAAEDDAPPVQTLQYGDLMEDSARVNCQTCSRYPEHKCSDSGMVFPAAAAGYYAKNLTVFEMPSFSLCTPFEACVGKCPDSVFTAEVPNFDDCPHAVGLESCAAGYTKDRCSECLGVTADLNAVVCDGSYEGDPLNGGLGFYRMNGRCERCPCSWIKLHHIIIAAIVIFILFLALVDWMTAQVDHVSTIIAPIMIMVTFGTTQALLLHMDFPWCPPPPPPHTNTHLCLCLKHNCASKCASNSSIVSSIVHKCLNASACPH
jgi:hypothetical protein